MTKKTEQKKTRKQEIEDFVLMCVVTDKNAEWTYGTLIEEMTDMGFGHTTAANAIRKHKKDGLIESHRLHDQGLAERLFPTIKGMREYVKENGWPGEDLPPPKLVEAPLEPPVEKPAEKSELKTIDLVAEHAPSKPIASKSFATPYKLLIIDRDGNLVPLDMLSHVYGYTGTMH